RDLQDYGQWFAAQIDSRLWVNVVIMILAADATVARRVCALAALAIFTVTKAVEVKYSSADRKSTRLNSSHVSISYAVFCLKKKNTISSSTLSCLCLHHSEC